MSLDVPTTTEEARTVLKQVIARCPLQHDKDPDCHLCAFKGRPPQLIESDVDAMSDEEVLRYCKKHNHCFWSKQGDR